MSKTPEACLACGHVAEHTRGEEEDTHIRCEHVTIKRIAGYECGHKRWRGACEDKRVDLGGCYTFRTFCECSSEDREIAALRARLAALQSPEHLREVAERIASEVYRPIAKYAYNMDVQTLKLIEFWSDDISCGEPAEWEAVVKASGTRGTAEETVWLCDPCARRGLLEIADALDDAEEQSR